MCKWAVPVGEAEIHSSAYHRHPSSFNKFKASDLLGVGSNETRMAAEDGSPGTVGAERRAWLVGQEAQEIADRYAAWGTNGEPRPRPFDCSNVLILHTG